MSRSAAQQIEHWARIGAALEASGLTVGEVALLLKTQDDGRPAQGDANLWGVQTPATAGRSSRVPGKGASSRQQLSWFPRGKARKLKLVNSPY